MKSEPVLWLVVLKSRGRFACSRADRILAAWKSSDASSMPGVDRVLCSALSAANAEGQLIHCGKVAGAEEVEAFRRGEMS